MTDLEDALTTMLRERAATDITSAPAFDPRHALATASPHTGRRRGWLVVAAAAASVIAVVASVSGVHYLTRDRSQPAHPRPAFHAPSCVVALPGTWAQALAAGAVSGIGARILNVYGVDASGTALVERVATGTGHPHQVVLVHADRTVSPVLTLGVAETVIDGGQDGTTGTVTTLDRSRGTVGVQVIDDRTGASREVASFRDTGTSTSPTLAAVVRAGHVYWIQGSGVHASVEDYDVASRTVRVLDSGEVSDIVTGLGGGISWHRVSSAAGTETVTHVADRLPGPVARGLLGGSAGWAVRSSDGTGYTWWSFPGNSSTQVRVWYPGMAAAVAIETDATSSNTFSGSSVAGPYVAWTSPGTTREQVLDTRTGAVATLPAGTDVIARDGTVVISTATALSILLVTALPELRC